MPAPLLAALLLFGAPPKLDFYANGPYDGNVPRPESLLGYDAGDRITTYHDQDRVVNAIANRAGLKVRMMPYGKSVQGRPLRVFAISSAANIARLDKIRANQDAMNLGKAGDPTMPTVVWVNQCIHGNEPASFESAMWLMYNLAAAKGGPVAKALVDAVVILNPVYNPDGHERFAVWYDAIATGSSEDGAFEFQEPSIIHGRTNFFRVDMNRDRVSFSQDETRAEFAEMLKWHPEIYIDQHGQVGTYFFPPEPESINVNVDRERNAKWTDYIGRAIGKAFDDHGFQYFTRETFDFYYPGYLDASTTLSGSIGMTHETDGGKYLNQVGPDGYTLTLRRGIEKHFTSALAVIMASAAKHAELNASFTDYKKKILSGDLSGKFRRVVVSSADPRPLRRLKEQLGFAGIESGFATKKWSQDDANDYWTGQRGKQEFGAGSLIVDIRQPQGALAKALLEPGQNFESTFIKAQTAKKKAAPEGEEYPGPEGPEFYDTTGWSLPYAHGLKAAWCESDPSVETSPTVSAAVSAPAGSAIGYLLRYSDMEDILAVGELLRSGVRGSVATKPMTIAGGSYPAGTFLFVADRNEAGYEKEIAKVAASRGVRFEPIRSSYPEAGRYSPGSDSVAALKMPKIGVVFGDGAKMADVSGIWYVMARVFKLPFTPLSVNALDGDLHDYTAIVVPGGALRKLNDKLKDWVNGGGTLVAFPGLGWALGSSGFVSLDEPKSDIQELPGTLFRANLDPRSILSYGYEAPKEGKIEIAVPVEGNQFYPARKKGGSVVTFGDEKTNKLLSGWEWPEDTEKYLANSVWLQDAPVGRGHAYLFGYDPTSRAMWPGLYKMLLNALLIN